jgi:hypothetical protein
MSNEEAEAAEAEEYAKRCARINPALINDEFVELPGHLAYWTGRYADAYEVWLDAKRNREQTYHRLSIGWRTTLEGGGRGKAKGSSRVTIGEVESHVVIDSDYIQAQEEELEAEVIKLRLHGVLEALRAKKEMLISLGAHIRLEMANDPLIRKEMRIEREMSKENPSEGQDI